MAEHNVVTRMMPHRAETEQAFLGALVIDPDAIYRVKDLVRPADLYVRKHRWVFQAVLDLDEREKRRDYETLCDELERKGQLDENGR